MHYYNIGAQSKMIAKTILFEGPSNQYLLIVLHYFNKGLGVYIIPYQEASTVVESLVTNFSCRSEVP
jgi:hypothetical protein